MLLLFYLILSYTAYANKQINKSDKNLQLRQLYGRLSEITMSIWLRKYFSSRSEMQRFELLTISAKNINFCFVNCFI